MRTVPRRSSIALLAAVSAVAAVVAAPSAATAATGDVIVKYAPGADPVERAEARANADVVARDTLPLPRTEVVAPEAGTTVARAVADLERSPDVAYAEPDAPRSAGSTVPNDPLFGWQWSLQNTGAIFDRRSNQPSYAGTAGDDIDVLAAWDMRVTKSDVTVGVVDSGVALEHPDLKANLLTGGKDIFDDDDTPQDENGHGTHVAGIIGAVGNNQLGISGIAWKASVLPVRVLGADGSAPVSTVVAGYTYAVGHGARIVNVSLGGDRPSQTEYDALRNAADTLFVVAAGNDAVNVDTTDSYPCAYDLPNVLCVAATGANDRLASFSDYGPKSVDIAAPGVDVLSTYPTALSSDRTWPSRWPDGTSMATPEVTGAAALVLGQDPALTPYQLREKLLASAHPVAGLEDKVASGGRLDVAAALAQPSPTDPTPASSLTAPPARQAATTPTPTTPTTPTTPVVSQPAPVASTPLPSTAPAPAPKRTADTTAPAVTPALATRGALKLLLARRLKASVATSERATVRFELRLDGRTAKKLHLANSSAKAVRIATGGATLTAAGTKAGTLRLTSAAKRALGPVRRLKVTLRATAPDAAGNARTRSRTVTITR